MDVVQADRHFEEMSEEALLALVRCGESQAFRTVMQRYNQPLYRTARGIVRDDAEAEDVVQEAWLRAFAAIAGFRGDAALLTWLTRIVINEAKGRLRKRRPQVELGELEAAQVSGSTALAYSEGRGIEDPESESAKKEVRILIERAVDKLPEPFRMVFLLRDVQECSIEETAAILEVKADTIKSKRCSQPTAIHGMSSPTAFAG